MVGNSANVYSQGRITELKVFDSNIVGAYKSYVEVEASLGNCIRGNTNVRLVFRDSDSKQYSMLLAAVMANKEIIANVDDAVKNSGGYCYLRSVQIAL